MQGCGRRRNDGMVGRETAREAMKLREIGFVGTGVMGRSMAGHLLAAGHIIKDMKIALDSARAMRLEPPGLALALSLYETLAADGGADLGTQALYTLIDRDA